MKAFFMKPNSSSHYNYNIETVCFLLFVCTIHCIGDKLTIQHMHVLLINYLEGDHIGDKKTRCTIQAYYSINIMLIWCAYTTMHCHYDDDKETMFTCATCSL